MTRFTRWFQVLAAAMFLGTVLAPGVGCLSAIAKNVNPCGTILNCDPLEYDLSWYDPTKDFPDYATDPTCTIPGFCGGTPFPPTGGSTIVPPPSDSGTGLGVGTGTGA